MRITLASIILTVASCTAGGDVHEVVMEWTDSSHTRAVLRPVQAGVDPATPQYGYDNWRNTVRGGQSERVDTVRVAGQEFGDDMQMVAPGLLTGENLTISHVGTQGRCLELTMTNRWYDQEGVLLRSFTFMLGTSASNLSPGNMLNIRADDGFWNFLQLNLPDRVFVSHQFDQPIGMDINDFGQAIAGPRTIGYSSQYIRNFTAGQDIDLGSDQLNLCLALRVDPVPTPSVCSIFAAGSALTIRRRR